MNAKSPGLWGALGKSQPQRLNLADVMVAPCMFFLEKGNILGICLTVLVFDRAFPCHERSQTLPRLFISALHEVPGVPPKTAESPSREENMQRSSIIFG